MADADGAAVAARELQEERERSQKMKQENQVLLKKLHDVVGRYRQLQQQYQSVVSERQDQQQASADAGAVNAKGGDASPTNSSDDAVTKKLEAEKHELIEKLKQVVGTCRIMQKQLQEAKEENEALKSPAKPPFSPSRASDSSEAAEALQVRIIGLERDLAQKEEEKEDIAGKLKEVIGRYQSLQRQLEEKIGEHDAAMSKVAALELELRTQQQQTTSSSSSSGVGWMRRGSGKNSNATGEHNDQGKDKEMSKLRDELQKLSVAMAQEEARTAVFREENARLKEQITSILREKQEQEEHVASDRSAAAKQLADLQREIKLMRKQQEDSEQLYLEVASKLNHTLRENGELQSRLASLQQTVENGDQLLEKAEKEHALELAKLQEQLDQAKSSSDSIASHSELIAQLRQSVEVLTVREQKLVRFESELVSFGVDSDSCSLTDVFVAKESKQREELSKRAQELMDELSASQHTCNAQREQLEVAHGQVDELSKSLAQLNILQEEIELLRSSASTHQQVVNDMEKSLRTAQDEAIRTKQELEALRNEVDESKSHELKIAQLDEEIAMLKVQLESATSNGSKTGELMAQLQQELSTSQHSLTERETQIQELNTAVEKLHKSHSSELEVLESKLNQLQMTYEHDMVNKDALVEEMTMALNAKNAAMQEIQGQHLGIIAEKEEQISVLTTTIEQLRLQSESLTAQKAEFMSVIEQHQHELAAVEDRLQSANRSVLDESSARVKELESEVEKRERELVTLRAAIEDLKAEITSLRDEHALLINSAGDSTKELAASHEAMMVARRNEHEAAIAALESRLSEKDGQMEKLRVEVASLQTQVMTMEAQQLQDDADAAEVANELRERIVVLERESESLQKEVADLREEKDNLQAQVSQMSEDLETTQMQKEEFDHLYREQEEEIEYLRGEVEELHQRSDRYAREIMGLRKELFALPIPGGCLQSVSPGALGSDEAEHQDTAVVMDKIREGLLRLEEVEGELREVMSSTGVLREKLYSASSQREAVESQLVLRETELEALNGQVETLKIEKETLREELETTRQTIHLHASKIADLTAGMESLQQVHEAEISKSLGQAGEKLAEVTSRLLEVESEMKAIKAENTRMVFEVAKTTDSAVKLKQDLEEAQAQLRSKSELCDRHEISVRELSGVSAQLKDELRISAESLDHLRAELESANKMVESVTQQSESALEEKRILVTSLQSQLSEALDRSDSLVSEYEITKSTLASLNQELHEWKEKCGSAETLVQQLTDQIKTTQDAKESLLQELQSVQASITHRSVELEAAREELTKQVERLSSENGILVEEKSSLEEKIRVLESQVDEYRSALDDRSVELEAAREELTKQVERLSSENGILVEEKSSLEEKIRVLESQVDEHRSALDDRSVELEAAREELTKQVERLSSENGILVEEKSSLEEKIRVLESQVDEHRSALDDRSVELEAAREELRAAASATQVADLLARLESKDRELATAISAAESASERERALAESAKVTSDELIALRQRASEAAATVEQKDEIIGKLKTKTEEVVSMYKKLKEHAQDLQERLGEKAVALGAVQSECGILKAMTERLTNESVSAKESQLALENELRDARQQVTQLQDQLATTSSTLGEELDAARAKVDELTSHMEAQLAHCEEELRAKIATLEEEKGELVKTVGMKDSENQEIVDKMKELLTRHQELEEKHQESNDHISRITRELEEARAEVVTVRAQHEDRGVAHDDAVSKLQSEVNSLKAQLEVEIEASNAARTALEVYKKRAATALKKATSESKTSMKKVEEETSQLQEDIVAANARAAALELELEQALKSLDEAKDIAETQIRSFREKAAAERARDEATWKNEIEMVRLELSRVQVELTAHVDIRVEELNATKASLEGTIEALEKELQKKTEAAREMIRAKDGEIAQLTKQLEEVTRSASETEETLHKVTEELQGAKAAAAAGPRSPETSRSSAPQGEDNHLAAAIADLNTSIPLATSSSNGGAVDNQILKLARAQALRDEEATKAKQQLHTLEEQVHFYQKKYEDALALLEDSNRQKRRIHELNTRATDGLNIEYLKNIVIKYIESQNQSEKDRLIPVIATVLHFSPQEVKRINDVQLKAQEESAGLLGGVFSLFGAAPAAPAPKPLAIPPNLNLKHPSPSSNPTGDEMEDDDEMTPLNPFASNTY